MKRHLIKLLQDGLVEALADAIGLFDFVYGEEQLEVVPVLTIGVWSHGSVASRHVHSAAAQDRKSLVLYRLYHHNRYSH